MHKVNKDEKGLRIGKVILAVVIVALVSTAGWIVYKNHHIATVASDSTDRAVNANTSKTPQSTNTPAAASSQASSTTFSKVPASLQEAIIAKLKSDVPSCVKNNLPVDYRGNPSNPRVDYDPSGFAATGIGCDGGSWGLFANVNNNWQFLAKTQFAFSCSLLTKYHYPKQLLALNNPTPECLDNDNHLQAYGG
jgi:hypothetical protein